MQTVKKKITKALEAVSGVKSPNLEFASREDFGDYSSNIALINAKKLNAKNPNELAKQLVEKLNKNSDLSALTLAKAEGGFINFWLKSDVLVDNLIQIDSGYGKSNTNNKKLAIVEYSSPNIAKPFTVGHLRSTIIGDAIANLLEATGYKVMRDNHLGDWGTQFGTLLTQISEIRNRQHRNAGKLQMANWDVKYLVNLYIKFHTKAESNPELKDEARAWFKKLEEGDHEARFIWQKCIDISFKEFDKIYNKLGVKFSKEFENGRGLGESFFESRMPEVVNELKKNNLLKVGENGAQLVFFHKNKYPPAMIIKSDGATLYHTRDLATDKYRVEKYNPDLIINEVGAEQTLYFRQLFEIEKMLGWYKEGQRVHVGHGLIRFKEGKMSTRKGNVIWMEDILTEAEKRAKKLGSSDEKLAEMVAIGALKYNDLKRDPKTEIVFDWDEILNMEGNSGPYLQYTVARANSVILKGQTFKGYTLKGLTLEVEELAILRSLIKFPEIVEASAITYSPNILCTYLYDLAQKFNSFYNKHKILVGSEQSSLTSEFRLRLTSAVATVLSSGLKLLGIEAPEKM